MGKGFFAAAVILTVALYLALAVFYLRYAVDNQIIKIVPGKIGISEMFAGKYERHDGRTDKNTKGMTPERQDEMIEKALAYLRAGNAAEGIKYYDAVVKANPENKRVWSNRSAAKIMLRDFRGAVEDATVSLEINPERNNAYFNRANAYFSLSEYRNALDDIDTYINIGEFDEKGHNTEISSYLMRGELLARLQHYREAIGALSYIEPKLTAIKDMTRAYHWLALSYKQLSFEQGSENSEVFESRKKADEYYAKEQEMKNQRN